MPEEAVVVKSPQELAAEAKAAEEARLKSQVPFDPTVHGVGTHPAMGPQTIAELTKFVLELAARVSALEQKSVVSPQSVPPQPVSTLKGKVQ